MGWFRGIWGWGQGQSRPVQGLGSSAWERSRRADLSDRAQHVVDFRRAKVSPGAQVAAPS
jgi:hypothetical protein